MTIFVYSLLFTDRVANLRSSIFIECVFWCMLYILYHTNYECLKMPTLAHRPAVASVFVQLSIHVFHHF